MRKKTYANLESIKRREELNDIERLNPTVVKQASNQKIDKKTSQKDRGYSNRNIKTSSKKNQIIEDKQDETPSKEASNSGNEFVQYEIEYGPKKDVLKYGAKKFNSKGQFGRQTHKNFENFSIDLDFSFSEDDLCGSF